MFSVEFLHVIRDHEILTILPYLTPGGRILEIGGGTGYQAKLLAARGFKVNAIDLPNSIYRDHQVYPVVEYDGRRFPFPDQSFDVVFSSNLLEHVEDLEQLHGETARVLKAAGYAVHIMPTTFWRFWTIVAHYVEMVQRVALELTHCVRPRGDRRTIRSAVSNAVEILRYYAAVPRHGETGNALTELVSFSAMHWSRHFRAHKLNVVECQPMRLFYTGHSVLGKHLPLKARQVLSRFAGSACMLWVATFPEKSSPGPVMEALPKITTFPLDRPFHPQGGLAFTARIPPGVASEATAGAEIYVAEDGRKLGPGGIEYRWIQERGSGVFWLGGEDLYFSSYDRTDPNKNEREYEIVAIDWRPFYDTVHAAAGAVPPTRRLLHDYAAHYEASPYAALIERCRTFSMLHQETLALLYYLALAAKGPVLELGAFLGAGTIAMASAGTRVIAVELGGMSWHPNYKDTDIGETLEKNLRDFGVRDKVRIIRGWTYDPRVREEVAGWLGEEKVGLFVVDADGCIDEAFDLYGRHLAEDALVVLDDYLVFEGVRKDLSVREWVTRAIETGRAKDLGVYPFGTWIGQLQRQAG